MAVGHQTQDCLLQGSEQPGGSQLFSQGSFGSQKSLPRMCGNVE